MGGLNIHSLLNTILQISGTSLPLETKIDHMLHSVADTLQAERCLFLHSGKISTNSFLAHVISERKPLWVEDSSSLPREKMTLEEEVLVSPSFGCLPICDETLCLGLLYVGFSQKRTFSSPEINTLTLVATEMGGALHHAKLHDEAEQTISELTGLHELGKVATSTLMLDSLLDSILAMGSRILRAKGGVVRLEDRKTGDLRVRSRLGDYQGSPHDEKLAKRIFFTQTPMSFREGQEGKDTPPAICAPLLSKGKCFGTIAFYKKNEDPSTFSDKDVHLLAAMANQTACAIENALTHYETSELAREHEKRTKRLSILWELNKVLLTTMNFERIIHLTLTAVTVGDGLAFNRAMLFLIHEKSKTLKGIMAVGPDSGEEAGRIWSTVSQSKGTLLDLIAQLQTPSHSESHLNTMVKKIELPLLREHCILVRTVREGKPFNVQVSQTHLGDVLTFCDGGCALGLGDRCPVSDQLNHEPRTYSFATVPLWGKGKVTGVILVDNLYNQNPITEEDLHFLTLFSNQAGMAIENARLYRHLEEMHEELKETQALLLQHEKMAALGELSNTIAHEIRNPLVSIGGFSRRLYRAVAEDVPEKRYAQTIMVEVARIEKILDDVTQYTHKDSPVSKACDLQEILEGSLSMISEEYKTEKLQVVKEFAPDLPKVMGDDRELKQAFFNLFINACQAMNGNGTLSVRATLASRNGTSHLRVEVKDTGNGIDPETLPNIFNPFYSTKEASLGMGLAIVHKIVTSHGGQIQVDNRPGDGATFIVTFPIGE